MGSDPDGANKTQPSATQVGRRGFLKAAGGMAVGVRTLGTAAETASAQEGRASASGWFDEVSNYRDVVDKTRQSEIQVSIDAKGNDGNFSFSPPAIHIDPNTTVVWQWAENSEALSIVTNNGSFWTELEKKEGDTFEWTLTGNRVVKYSCPAYEQFGMKGLIVVGDPDMPTIREILSTP